MSEYTPTTEQVKHQCTVLSPGVIRRGYISGPDFDRWLAAHDEQIRQAERERIARQVGDLRDVWIAAANRRGDRDWPNYDPAMADSYRSRAWDLNDLFGRIARGDR